MNASDPIDGACQQRQSLEGVVLGLHRNENLVSGNEGIDRHNAETRRAVNDDVVKRVLSVGFT